MDTLSQQVKHNDIFVQSKKQKSCCSYWYRKSAAKIRLVVKGIKGYITSTFSQECLWKIFVSNKHIGRCFVCILGRREVFFLLKQLIGLRLNNMVYRKALEKDLNIFCSVSCKYSASNYTFKVNYSNTRPRCEIYSKLTIKTLLVSFWRLYC